MDPLSAQLIAQLQRGGDLEGSQLGANALAPLNQAADFEKTGYNKVLVLCVYVCVSVID